jgi:hypothetical protein
MGALALRPFRVTALFVQLNDRIARRLDQVFWPYPIILSSPIVDRTELNLI